MATSPLQPTPVLSRLLAPEEQIIYTAKLHPLHGWVWLLFTMVLVAVAYWWIWLLVPAFITFAVYWLPFHNHEMAVTTHRVLIRRGRFRISLDDIAPDHLDHYQFHQNPLLSALHCGHIILNLRISNQIGQVPLDYMWHPMSFLEALTTLNPTFRAR